MLSNPNDIAAMIANAIESEHSHAIPVCILLGQEPSIIDSTRVESSQAVTARLGQGSPD